MQQALQQQTSDQRSQVSQEISFETLANLNPAEQTEQFVIDACLALGESLKHFFEQNSVWLFDLKRRFEVRNGSKGRKLEVNGEQIYWHEFLEKYFNVSRRHIQRLEKGILEGTYEPTLEVGDAVKVIDENGEPVDNVEGVVTKIHETVDDKVDVDFGEKEVTMSTDTLEKVKIVKDKLPKKLTEGNRYADANTNTVYLYVGDGKLKREEVQPVIQAKRDKDVAALKAKQDKAKADADKVAERKRIRKAEAAARDLAKIRKRDEAEAARKQKTVQKKADKAARDAQRIADKAARAKPHAEKAKATIAAAVTKTWMVRRIGETNRFGVICSTAPDESIMIDSKEACETRRDELTAKYAEKATAAAV
jgi:hypothetical protein